MPLDCRDDITQQRIPCAMAMAVVDLLERVDVDVGENEMTVSVACAVDLTVEQRKPISRPNARVNWSS